MHWGGCGTVTFCSIGGINLWQWQIDNSGTVIAETAVCDDATASFVPHDIGFMFLNENWTRILGVDCIHVSEHSILVFIPTVARWSIC